ncbi:MAG TPA: hypothetical protein VGC13_21650 [Longimicrobium sp.]|uniref:hypothetical protein n=1 Tax=Longimicrobium sp. TaxID=2029185 RepID=UPI002EDA9E42
MRRKLMGAALALAALAGPAALAAQDGDWNSGRALELVQRAQERRQVALSDTGMVDYQADARGYIYFYLDRRDTGERTLVKTDQVALDVFWKAPNLAKQRIVGLRDERNLPTNIRYHEDHLTVVQDNFGDLIRLGDGDEVADVLHPAAASGPAAYDYRLADSTTIRLPGAGEPVRVYKVQVRPKDASRPALVGSIFVDRRGGDIVRMEFTFTPVSYVDEQLDYINVLLENGLYKGRFWLPNRQQVELRRQVPELGLPAGGMIRGTMRISNYRFNQDLPAGLFAGRRVVSVPVAEREAFAFEQGIDAELREAGLAASGELGDIRREAAELVGRRLLSGLPGTRIDLSSASGTLRYNRAEGLAVGPGLRFSPGERLSIGVRGGYATGAEHAFGEVDVWRGALPDRFGLGVYANQPRDVGVGPVISGAMNSVTALLAGYDFTDPYFATGAELRVDRPVGRGWNGALRLRGEEHRQAQLETDFSLLGGGGHFRPVRPIAEGEFYGGSLSVRRGVPAEMARGLALGVTVDGGVLASGDVRYEHWRPRLDAGWISRGTGGSELTVDASAGAAFGDVPPQGEFLLGGRGTVPGYAFRAYGGHTFAFGRAAYAADLFRPFIRGRVFAAAGWTERTPDAVPFQTATSVIPPVPPIPPLRTGSMFSIGAGVGLLFDIIRIDVARGLGDDGQWEVIVEANPSFWDFL